MSASRQKQTIAFDRMLMHVSWSLRKTSSNTTLGYQGALVFPANPSGLRKPVFASYSRP
jgi:hypothetical protein